MRNEMTVHVVLQLEFLSHCSHIIRSLTSPKYLSLTLSLRAYFTTTIATSQNSNIQRTRAALTEC